MIVLILGLAMFLGIHSLRIFADDWRSARIQQWGEKGWMAFAGAVSLVGFILIILGYGKAAPIPVWSPPMWLHHVTALLSLLAFIILAAAFVPGNHIKAAVKHPMVIAVKAWAFGHLLANGMLADILLFGAFLVWSVLCFRSLRQRDQVQGSTVAAANLKGTAITVAAGLAGYLIFAFFLHEWLIGVPVK
ncbi:NnrU family protein [Ectothiorhodospira sp. PHS-1]|uniref:NnrU family protein n=1 Tax=Ectothiorhodospira sp. PHS-1 TaxID=519989 RepID=UPI00024A8935|nr:NnrU family protein [Ectothiorhodospira sp. PHS-1]EHQ53023.1 NnrU family protein [Ectothiorhodospira sp. PHS-1]